MMERIYLTKQEKEVLKSSCQNKTFSLSQNAVYFATKALEDKGFVEALYLEGEEVGEIRLLPKGEIYYRNNTKLRNPINWAKVSAIIAMIAAIMSFTSMLYTIIRDFA